MSAGLIQLSGCPIPPLSDAEVRSWLMSLGYTDEKRIAMLRDLVRNANGDGMSEYDRAICVRELKQLVVKVHLAKTGANNGTGSH